MESQAPKRSEALQRFQELLRELFEFECADLDFGIYRIMNHKREIIKDFIENKLPNIIREELSQGTLAEQTRAHQELQQAAAAVRESLGEYAINPDGSLLEQFRGTPVGKQYLEALQKATHARSLEAVETAIYHHLYTFFSRYWQEGDFISKRRYSKREHYAIPYNGEEVYLYWANHELSVPTARCMSPPHAIVPTRRCCTPSRPRLQATSTPTAASTTLTCRLCCSPSGQQAVSQRM